MDVSELKEALPPSVSPIVHVEICQKSHSNARENVLKDAVSQLIQEKPICFRDMMITKFTDPILAEHVKSVSVGDTDTFIKDKQMGVNLLSCRLHLHVYSLNEEGAGQEDLEEDGELAAAHHWLLPYAGFQGIWESLVFDSQVKSQLLQYTTTTALFSDKNVDTNIISWNRVVLLHGPPGTGKTSLCKALAQKLSINLSDRYRYGQLIEINSHSLFSKWFSESGKLVMKMFQKIQELIDDKDSLVCVLIDEVESLTAARKSAMSGNEPSDAIRVVNALLTQLDKIKENPNVLILTTSNITGAIDLAFVDRADIKQYIGPPSPSAIHKIYYSCIAELKRTEIINCDDNLFELDQLEVWKQHMENGENHDSKVIQNSQKLWTIALKSEGLSGRTLRKLPFIAHAIYLQSHPVSMSDFLDALNLTVDRQFKERSDLNAD